MSNRRINQQQRDQWREALETALAQPEEPLLVQTFTKAWNLFNMGFLKFLS